MKQLQLDDITIDIVLKDIKNLRLGVYPPNGRVRIAAPFHMNLDTIRCYAISKLSWIKRHQQRFHLQRREAPRQYLHGESHYFLGECYLLKVLERSAPPSVTLTSDSIEMCIRPSSTMLKRHLVMKEWYRTELKTIISSFVGKWEPQIGVSLNEFGVKDMKTRWGTCNRQAKRIWLNLELAKRSLHCIEYVVVHEMVHLLERYHNAKFFGYMDYFLPEWKHSKVKLNSVAIGYKEEEC